MYVNVFLHRMFLFEYFIDVLYHIVFQLTFCNIVTIDEKLVYSPHPADSSK